VKKIGGVYSPGTPAEETRRVVRELKPGNGVERGKKGKSLGTPPEAQKTVSKGGMLGPFWEKTETSGEITKLTLE